VVYYDIQQTALAEELTVKNEGVIIITESEARNLIIKYTNILGGKIIKLFTLNINPYI